MSKNTTLTDIAISNEHSLKRLIRAIALSFDQFSLILVRCNYTELCKQVLDNIRSQTKDVNLREVFLSPSTKALHTTIVSELFLDIPAVKTDCLPTAVMVFGLESVTNLEDLLSGINQARDIYADTFSFPIVLWLKDEVGTSLSRFAPDFKSWAATTIKFEMAAPDLVTLIEQQTQSLFDKVIEAGAQKFLSNEALLLDPKSQQRREIESARNDLQRLYQIKLEPQLEASLEFVLGRDNYVNDNIDKALLHYQRSLELWEEEIKSNSVSLIGNREQGVGNRQQGVGNRQQEFSPHLLVSPSPHLSLPSLIRQAVVMFHLALCYRRLADLQPAANISFWQNALNWFKQCLDIFETINRKDLSAKFIYPACEVLQRLEQWDDLSELATYSLELHQSFNNKTLVAQDYGFLCVVAASKSDWVKAHELASTALSIAEEVPEVSRSSESWYLLLLGRTLRNLSEWDEAVNTLEWAKVVCEAQYEPSLYLEIVEELRSLYFNERHDYLEAFKLKREKIQIEHQYGFRAFIGASQLQPQRYRINPVLQPQKISSTPDQVAQEIAASGRQRDVHHLLEKMTRADCKLTVVHGPSGVGKSSIIKAGLVPALKQNAIGERMALPIVLSVYTDWITALGRSLNQVIARTSISLAIEITVDVILEKLKLLADNNYTIILIFDQLEEFFFVKQDTAQRIEFYKFFNKCLNIPFVKVILSLREDYLHYLLEFERLSYLETNDSYNLGVINKNILDKNIRYYLGKFTCQDANSIIHSLTERSHYQLSEELIDKLVEDLAAETYQVHPIELQIVGAQLETENITTLGEYQRSGGSEKLVQNWLEKVIYDCGQENEELSWKLLFELTDEKGTRPLKTKAELVTAIFTEEEAYDSEGNTQTDNLLIDINQNIDSAFSKVLKQPKKQYEVGNNKEIEEDFMHSYNVSTLELILEILVGSGLVLRVLQESGERYQLVHDYLVKPIRVRNDYGIVAELEKIRFEKTKAEVAQKLSQKKLNLILQKRLREARLAGFALAVMSTSIGGLWWQADLQKKAAMSQSLRAERSENNFKIGALTAASEALFASNKEFDALVESLRAWRKIKSGHGIQPDTKMRVVTALQQAVYGVTEVNRLEGHKDIVWDVNFSPDGKLLASGSRDKSVKIWRTDGSLLQTLKAHNESITSLTFSSDGSLLASASRDNTVKIWRKNPATRKFYSQPVTTLGHPDWVDKVSFSPDGKLLVTGSKDQTVRIWRSDGKLLKTLEGHQGWINWVTFSPDGQFIASASDDNTVKIWSRDGALLTTLPAHEEGITVVNFSPDGKKLASAGRNGIVKLWRREQKDGETGFTYRAYKDLEQHKGIVWSLNFDSEGKKLASAGDDNTINLIDVSSGKLIKTFKGHSDAVVSVSFSPDNKLLASASYDKSVKLWSLNPPKLPVLQGHSDRVLSVAWSPDGKILASSSRDNTVKLWQREPKNTGFDTRLYKTLLGHTDKVASVSFHPDGEILASASYDKTIKLWQRDGQLIKTLKGHNDSVTSISFSGDGKLLASASKDKTVKLWNLKGKLVKTLKGHQGRVNSVRFSTDKHSQALASGSDDQTVKLWQRDGVLLKTFLPHSGWVLGVSFSPSDNLLASASWDNTVRLWRWDGTLLKTLLKGYGDSVSNVTFSPNGEILAAASWDSTVKLWSTEGKLIKTLNEHHAPVLDVSFSPDGQTLASASDDNTIVLWNLDLKNLLVKGCHWVGDYLKYNRNVENRDRNLCQGIS